MADELATTNQCTEITPKKRLTPKQRKFVKLYIESGFNATEACRRMGYGDSPAQSTGSRLARNCMVVQYVDDFLRDQGVSKPRLLTELTRLAYDTNPDAKMVPLKSKAIDMISRATGLDAPMQQVVQQAPLVSLLVNSDIGTTSIVGLPREMQSASGPGDAESATSVGLRPVKHSD